MRKRIFKLSLIILSLALGIALGLGILLYGPHLIWKLKLQALPAARNVKSIPVSPLPEVQVPDDFARCRFGSISFSVPRGMVSKPEFKGTGLSRVVLRDGKREVVVVLPKDNRQVLEYYRA